MIKKLRITINRYIFTEEVPLEGRLLNMVCFIGIIASFLAFVSRLIQRAPLVTTLLMPSIIIAVLIFFTLSNKYKSYTISSWIMLIVLGDVIFPAIFFSYGGMFGGMSAYFVLSLVTIFLTAKGWTCAILVATHSAVILTCYIIDALIGGVGETLEPYQLMVDNLFAILNTGFFLGVVIRFQSLIYEKEKARADSASRAKGDFLANMSHEIRTPMNAIIGMTAMAKGTSDLERKDYCLNKIDDASTHLLGVINDILDMSKIEANKFELSYARFNFEKVLMKVSNVVNFKIDEKDQNFIIKYDKAIPDLLIGDDHRLNQVIANLLSNAAKFTPVGGSITLHAHLVDERDGICTIQIDVSDTGIGVSAEQQSKLFTSFSQADGGISRKYGGTGLGLAISKQIVELMGGRIWVDSELGAGSTFSFTMKAKRAIDESYRPARPALSLRNLRALVVDDAQNTLEYVREILLSFDMPCDTAAGGSEALELINANGSYDLYFIDLKMPDMDGITLVGKINKLLSEKQIPSELPITAPFGNSSVILMSGINLDSIENEARNAGITAFLPKPLFVSSVTDCIHKCLGTQNLPAKEDVETSPGNDFNGCRVILAEDIDINREIVLALLEPTGIIIDCAESGVQALKLFVDNPGIYDMIFMDIHMPEMDGYEATRRIRALGTDKALSIPIVAMTANVFREDIEKCLEAGMNDHVGKPIDIDELLARLKKYLPAPKARQENN